jgi:hypothetical protein
MSEYIEDLAKGLYDDAMANRDTEMYGYLWTPWEDLDREDQAYWLEIAEEQLA